MVDFWEFLFLFILKGYYIFSAKKIIELLSHIFINNTNIYKENKKCLL